MSILCQHHPLLYYLAEYYVRVLAILLLFDRLEEFLVYFVLLSTKHVCELKTLTRGGVGRGLGMVIAGAEAMLLSLKAAARSAVVTKPTVPRKAVGIFFSQLFFHCILLGDAP